MRTNSPLPVDDRSTRSAAPARLLSFFTLLAATITAGCSAPEPNRSQRSPSPSSGESFTLPCGAEAYVPASLKREQRRIDLLVHFHGASEIVKREVDLAALQSVVVIVNYKGLSSAYEKPYSDPERFATLLDEARTTLRENGVLRRDGDWRRICLSSFSAGYGAIRALLSRADDYKRIAGVYLADSLYAGWKDEMPYTGVDPADVAPFRRLAHDAAAGRKTMIVSHSYFDPKSYAGTHVTADDLIAQVGIERAKADEAGPSDMRIVARAEAGQFKVWGCTAPADEHGRHLQNMHYWLAYLPLDRSRAFR